MNNPYALLAKSERVVKFPNQTKAQLHFCKNYLRLVEKKIETFKIKDKNQEKYILDALHLYQNVLDTKINHIKEDGILRVEHSFFTQKYDIIYNGELIDSVDYSNIIKSLEKIFNVAVDE